MRLTNAEVEAILRDESKRVFGDIAWKSDEDHSLAVEFVVPLESEMGWPLVARGSYNRHVPAVSFALILKNVGRIYALDVGKEHHNPQCVYTGDLHKHRWNEQFRDKEAYVPTDITAAATDPVHVWEQFCLEALITHDGKLHAPPPIQRELF